MAMNAQVLGKTRPKLADGNVFRIVMPGDIELYGLVAVASIESMQDSIFPLEGSTLVYVYRPGKTPFEAEVATVDDLLIPPTITNRLGFTRFGTWRRVDRSLPTYSYGEWDAFIIRATEALVDVWSRPKEMKVARERLAKVDRVVLPQWSKVATYYGLTPVPMIDDMISDALGIPRAVVTPEDFR